MAALNAGMFLILTWNVRTAECFDGEHLHEGCSHLLTFDSKAP